jgi:low affinity Fe/Cu permease
MQAPRLKVFMAMLASFIHFTGPFAPFSATWTLYFADLAHNRFSNYIKN